MKPFQESQFVLSLVLFNEVIMW